MWRHRARRSATRCGPPCPAKPSAWDRAPSVSSRGRSRSIANDTRGDFRGGTISSRRRAHPMSASLPCRKGGVYDQPADGHRMPHRLPATHRQPRRPRVRGRRDQRDTRARSARSTTAASSGSASSVTITGNHAELGRRGHLQSALCRYRGLRCVSGNSSDGNGGAIVTTLVVDTRASGVTCPCSGPRSPATPAPIGAAGS